MVGWSRGAGVALAAVLGLCSAASAEDYPTRTVKIIVPFAAGGSADERLGGGALRGRDTGVEAADVAEQAVELRLRGGPRLGLRLLARVLRGRGLSAHQGVSFCMGFSKRMLVVW